MFALFFLIFGFCVTVIGVVVVAVGIAVIGPMFNFTYTSLAEAKLICEIAMLEITVGNLLVFHLIAKAKGKKVWWLYVPVTAVLLTILFYFSQAVMQILAAVLTAMLLMWLAYKAVENLLEA